MEIGKNETKKRGDTSRKREQYELGKELTKKN